MLQVYWTEPEKFTHGKTNIDDSVKLNYIYFLSWELNYSLFLWNLLMCKLNLSLTNFTYTPSDFIQFVGELAEFTHQ